VQSEKRCYNAEKTIAKYLNNIALCSAIDRESAISCSLPVGKDDRLMAYRGLIYSFVDFFHFVSRIEKCFETIILNKNILIFGPSLSIILMMELRGNKSLDCVVFDMIGVSDAISQDIYFYILKTYIRMRGKDIARRIMSHTMHGLKLHTMQSVCAATNKSRVKKLPDDATQEETADHVDLLSISNDSDSDDE